MTRLAVVLSVTFLCVLGDIDLIFGGDSFDNDYPDVGYTYFYDQESTTPETTIPDDDSVFNSLFATYFTTSNYPALGSTTEEENTINYENEFTTSTDENVESHEVQTVNPEVNMLIQNLTQTISNLTSEVKRQQEQLVELGNKNTRLQEKVELIEQETKTNSLIFFNVLEKDRETYKDTLNKILFILNKIMKLKTQPGDIAVALRVDSEKAGPNRPIRVRFTNFVTKMQVLAARYHLQHSQVVIESDFSEGVARTRAQLITYMNAAKAKRLNAFILYDRLVVNGRKWTLQQLIEESQANKNKELLP